MKNIRLLAPADKSLTEELQAFQMGNRAAASCKDRSVPRPIRFAWEGVKGSSERPVYELSLSRDSKLREPYTVNGITDPSHSVVNLHVGTRYFWKVSAKERDSVVAASPIWSFTTHPSIPRWLNVPGMTNVRDLGGWPLPENKRIRQGMVYRGSEMNGHLEITPEGKRILVEDLGIRTDIDLRGGDEDFRPVLDQARVKWISIPIEPYGGIVTDNGPNMYRQIFRVFSDPSAYPLLFHCWGGCDRGGTVAFLLAALLGASMDSLSRDYEFSSLSIWDDYTRLSPRFQTLLCSLLPFGEGTTDIGMQVAAYLRSIGVTDGEVATIRSLLIVSNEHKDD